MKYSTAGLEVMSRVVHAALLYVCYVKVKRDRDEKWPDICWICRTHFPRVRKAVCILNYCITQVLHRYNWPQPAHGRTCPSPGHDQSPAQINQSCSTLALSGPGPVWTDEWPWLSTVNPPPTTTTTLRIHTNLVWTCGRTIIPAWQIPAADGLFGGELVFLSEEYTHLSMSSPDGNQTFSHLNKKAGIKVLVQAGLRAAP